MTKALKALAALVVVALAAGGIWWLGRATARALPPTVADLEVVHSGVLVSDNATVGSRRLSVGSTVVTDADGRARLRLDDGTTAVLDRDSEIRITEKGLALTRGRSFVVAAEDARTELSILEAKAVLSGANCGVDLDGATAHLYSANEEIVITAGGKEHKVHAGESATLTASAVEVAPAKTFDDWTGGLASPWGVNGTPRRTRSASGRTIGGRLSSDGWAISTETDTGSPSAPNESTGR